MNLCLGSEGVLNLVKGFQDGHDDFRGGLSQVANSKNDLQKYLKCLLKRCKFDAKFN